MTAFINLYWQSNNDKGVDKGLYNEWGYACGKPTPIASHTHLQKKKKHTIVQKHGKKWNIPHAQNVENKKISSHR